MATGIAALAASLLVGVTPAAAHPNDPNESDQKHAAQDLAGVSITKIEKDTRAAARRIEKATGDTPGRRTDDQQIENSRASSRAAANPSQGGEWGSVINTPVVPILQALLPNGKVLMWDSVGDNAAESYPDQSFTRAAVWDPVNDTAKRVDVVGYNIFCAGFVQLADGRVLVAGGNKDQALSGIVQTHLFDWHTDTWSRGPDMAAGRWYPSVAALANGEALIVGGGPTTAEVYQTNGSLRSLTGFSSFGDRLYPFLAPRPDGKVELVGPHKQLQTMSTSGAGALTAAQDRDQIDRTYGSFATYDIGKILVAGGGNLTEDGQANVPTKTARIVDVNGSGTTVDSTGSMSVGRRQANLTVLADGSVLATGGESSAVDSLVDLQHPVLAAERWNPATGAWTVLASASRVRQYHSAATLLPDGRVLTGGGGVCGICVTKGYLEKNIEYFSPPYLFSANGQPAARPSVSNAPATAAYAKKFTVSSTQASSIKKVGMVRLGAPTHSEDQGQRYVPLSFSRSGSTLTITAPATANIAPPGYYMLFVTNSAGVPAKAKIIRVGSRTTKSDYDGDKKADPAVWRPANATWYVRGVGTTAFGASGDQPVAADYTGDRKTDLAVWRPSTGHWDIRGQAGADWGISGDKPVPADYDGDGRAEVAVWRPSSGRWYIRGQASVAWGTLGDIPVPADYDGDGKTDLAVWRPSNGTWYVRGQVSTSYGVAGDQPVPADYDGNAKAEIAVWRPSNGRWYVRGESSVGYGASGDVPVPRDFDGDGRTEIAVWRPSTGQWRILGASDPTYGTAGDVPV